jgi:AraC-like DNA-binding protein
MKFSALWAKKAKLSSHDKKNSAKPNFDVRVLTLLFIECNENIPRWRWDNFEPEHICHVSSTIDMGRQMAQDLMPDYILCDVSLSDDAVGAHGFSLTLGLPPTPDHVPLMLLLTAWDESHAVPDLGAGASVNAWIPLDERKFLLRVCEVFFNRTVGDNEPGWQRPCETEWHADQMIEGRSVESRTLLAMSSADRQFLNSVHTTILEALGKSSGRKSTITLPRIAKACGRSARVVQRKLTALTGMSFSEYKTQLRMREARKLLRGAASVTDIAMALGYTSAAHFSAAFKTVHSMPPKVWRQRLDAVGASDPEPTAAGTAVE